MSGKSRKHRVVVEVTMKYACTEKLAVEALMDDFLNGSYPANPLQNYNFKAFSKVLAGLAKTRPAVAP